MKEIVSDFETYPLISKFGIERDRLKAIHRIKGEFFPTFNEASNFRVGPSFPSLTKNRSNTYSVINDKEETSKNKKDERQKMVEKIPLFWIRENRILWKIGLGPAPLRYQTESFCKISGKETKTSNVTRTAVKEF